MKVMSVKIKDCYQLLPEKTYDNRGGFVKTFNKRIFEERQLDIKFCEEYFTFSKKNVLRGLHFQLPPHEYNKLVLCVSGKVTDVIVDLRIGSQTFGEFEVFDLNSDKANMLYLSGGIAHGFYVLSEMAIMFYKVTASHSAEHDSGILWNSLNIPWPNKNPILSERDKNFQPFLDFKSPFLYKKSE